MKWLCVMFILTPACWAGFNEPQNLTSSNPCADTNHLFFAPGVLTAGGTNRACVSRFHTEGPARIVLTLVVDDVQATTASRELPPGDGGCIDIAVPQKPNTKARLVAKLWYPEAKCTWERQLTILISGGRVVVVQTERARYRPGETLRARIIALKPDLTPAHGLIDEVWLEGPLGAWEGSRAAQWLRVRTRMGMAQVQHELDELAPAGRWTMKAKLADGSHGSAVFWVGNYELPPFQLSVRHAPRVLRTAERLVWSVCVRYPWTEAVEGMVVIHIRGAGGASPHAARSSIRTVARIRAPRACHRHAAAARRVGLNQTDPPDVIIADFSFQEEGTRIWQNTTVVSQVVSQPVTLEFLRKMGAVISPGLPYKLKVKATRWDDKPAVNERVLVCRTTAAFAANLPHASNDSCLDAVTDDRGIARVTFTASDDGSSYYSFQASLHNDSSVAAAPLHLPARHAGSMHASLGPIKSDPSSTRTFVPLYINLRNVSKPLTVHFVVITRGGVIHRWGATTQCPVTSSSDYIPTTSRNSQCYYSVNAANYQLANTRPMVANTTHSENSQANDETSMANSQINAANTQIDAANIEKDAANTQKDAANYQENMENTQAGINETNDPDSLIDRHLLRVILPIKVTHQMCPDSHLVAYFYYNGELVSASKQFEKDDCFSNKVEATWVSRQVAPGSLASLLVSTPGPALCALTAVDSSSKLSKPAPSVKDLVMTGLRRLMDSHRNLTEYEAAGACFKTSDIPEQPTNSLEQMATWLAAAGVRMTGGDMTDSRRCSSPPAPLMDDATVPRSDFSETWLWRLTAVGTNGSSTVSARAPDAISRYEAAAVCLARTGIAVSPPSVLQVFREFFIHADAPRRLRRGDATVVRYRLFNYLYEPLSVQIQILTDAHLEGPAEPVEAACVPARASAARRAELQARLPGAARLALRATPRPAAGCGRPHQPSVSDEVIISITIDPEGVPVQEHKSVLLCGRGSLESKKSEVSWSWPPVQPVPGTEMLTVWAMGDVKGPLLFDADGLVTLPRGCGEQNMARLAANLLALTQLMPDSAAAMTAKEHVSRGFTRQLQYAHPSGGFSAFGAADAAPSTWLTAFALKYLRRAHQILSPNLPLPPVVERAERWLLGQQMENGCFRNEGQVFHRELKGGLNEEGEIASVALTAYVITALVDSTAPLPARVLRNTLACLRALPPMKTRTPTRVYAHALLGYAFMRLRNYEDELRKTNEASLLWDRKEAIGAGLKEDEELRELMELLKIAKRSEDYVWWETSSLSTSIEATAYALLALSYCPGELRASSCAADARAAIRWLSAHRNHAGGFLSTQDTLVALEALSRWSSVQPSTPPNLTVRLHSGGDQKKIQIQPDIKVPEVTRITAKSQVDVSVEGTGCALIQATRSYNTLSSDETQDKHLTVQATVYTDGVFDCDFNRTNCFCAAVVEVCVSWTGVFPAMALVEATLPAGYGADANRLYEQLQQPDTLLRRIEVSPNGGRVTLYLSEGEGAGAGAAGAARHGCAALHAVGPRARTKPAHVRVLDYYSPRVNDTQMYTIPEDCPPRIAHTTNDYHSSDNLFNKARSLTDNGEILIMNEFSFEDIPEGIPLEDPLYEMSRDDVAYLTKYNEVTHARHNIVDDPKAHDDIPKQKNTDIYNHINKEMKRQSNENVEDISTFRTQHRNNLNNKVKTAVDQRKRNYENRRDINQRRGHSIPFIPNYSGRNFNKARLNNYGNLYYRQYTDQSHLHPEPIFYEFNPYYRRIDEHNTHRMFYQDTKPRTYESQYVDHYKVGVTRSSIARFNHGSNVHPFIGHTGRSNNDTYIEHHTQANVYTNSEHSEPSKYYQAPIGELNHAPTRNSDHKEITIDRIPELTNIGKEYMTTTSTYTTKPVFGIFEELDRTLKTEPSQSSLNNQAHNEPTNIQTENPNFQIPNHVDHSVHTLVPQKPSGDDISSNMHVTNYDTRPIEEFEKVDVKSDDLSSNLNPSNHNIGVPNTPSPHLEVPHDNEESHRIRDQLHSTISSNLSNIQLAGSDIYKESQTVTLQPIHSLNPANYNSDTLNSNSDPSVYNYNFGPVSSTYSPEPSNLKHDSNFHTTPSIFGPELSNYNPSSSNYGLVSSNYNPELSHFEPEPSKNPFANHNLDPPSLYPNPSFIQSENTDFHTHKQSQKVSSPVDNPNLSDFHVIDSEADLEVPTGMEGPVPAVLLPPENFVAVAPPPGFVPQPPFLHDGYPRLYPAPPQRYYRHVPAG